MRYVIDWRTEGRALREAFRFSTGSVVETTTHTIRINLHANQVSNDGARISKGAR